MSNSLTFEQIKDFYDRKLWSEEAVNRAVGKGVITPEQFTEITGQEYVPLPEEASLRDFEKSLEEIGVL